MMEELNPNKLGKRLAYILRYGAMKEGLDVSGEGFVSLDDLMTVDILKSNSKSEILTEVGKKTLNGKSRFELICREGKDLIRATFGRNFAPVQTHGGKVLKLLEICLSYVCDHIKLFDLEDFPDSFLLNQIFYRLKFEKKLTNSAMPSVIGKAMDSIDFNGIYITEKTLKLVYERCPNLQSISLKSCGYLVTDSVLQRLLKALPLLRRLNICSCESVTDQGIRYIAKYTKSMAKLNISCLPLVTEKGLKELIAKCSCLVELYVQVNPKVDQALIDELLAMRQWEQSSAPKLQIFASCNT